MYIYCTNNNLLPPQSITHSFIFQNKNYLSSKGSIDRPCSSVQIDSCFPALVDYVKKHLPPSGESANVMLPDSSPKFLAGAPRRPLPPPPPEAPPNPEAFPRGRPPCDPPKFPNELDWEGGGRRLGFWRCWPPGSNVFTPPCGNNGSSSSSS